MLDLGLPELDGHEVTRRLRAAGSRIPVIVLTTSEAEQDILQSYRLHANCYISKPVNFDRFMEVVRSVEGFWLGVVTLPPSEKLGQIAA